MSCKWSGTIIELLFYIFLLFYSRTTFLEDEFFSSWHRYMRVAVNLNRNKDIFLNIVY